MMTEYEIDQVRKLLTVVQFMIVKSDDQGLTHGEKHHFHHVALQLLGSARSLMGLTDRSTYDTRTLPEISPSDIPF